MNVIFMGTPQIACDVLTELVNLDNINLLGVICQPDRELDRKKNIIFSPVKQFCINNNIKTYQPEKISSLYDELSSLKIDLFITCAYGQFIPDKIINLARIGAFNLHASLLPLLRGGAPIHWAIINGFNETGITLMRMIKKMDAGAIIKQKSCLISPNETTSTLTKKLSLLTCEILKENWSLLSNPDEIKKVEIEQNEIDATFGLNITKEDMKINFYKNAHEIDCLVRGLYDKPIARWNYKDIEIKVFSIELTNIKSKLNPGQITKFDKTGLFVSTNDFDIKITSLQLPGKKITNPIHLLNGNNPFNS
ncbi:MAG: methionyl-tRNA formyltransferase [Ureaplasma sp.]|nr:methionyl-tRNA formyltransferase [Ureaplasma sp.]